MISHLSIGVSDLSASIAFYDAVLFPLGVVRVWTAGDAAGYGPRGGEDVFALKQQPEPVIAPGPGFHLAFSATNRASVDEFHKAALAFGGSDTGEPGLREQYSPTYYAAFVKDRDGHKIEAVYQ